MKKIVPICFLMTVLAVSGCKDDDFGSPSAGAEYVPLVLELGSIGVQAELKAAIEGSAFPSDRYLFGICIHDYTGGVTDPAPMMDGYDDIEATAVVKGTTVTWNYRYSLSTNEVTETYSGLSLLKNVPAILHAYYPYNPDLTGSQTHDAIRFTTNEQKDWMYSYPPVTFDAEQTSDPTTPATASLNFRHVMTCIEVSLQNLYEGDITLDSITLTDTSDDAEGRLCSGGTFSAVTGEVTVTEADRTKSITIDKFSDKTVINSRDSKSYYFIIPPISGYDGSLELSFRFNGSEKAAVWPIPTSIGGRDLTVKGFEKESKYKYTLKVDNTMEFAAVEVDDRGEELWGAVAPFDIPL